MLKTFHDLVWMPSADVDAQTAHFFVAMFIMAQARAWQWKWYAGAGIVVAFAVGKEFIFDFAVERDSWVGSARDFAWYGIGMCVGYFLQRATGAWGKRRFSSMPEFKECKDCAAKMGTPLLCDSCFHNRGVIDRLWTRAEGIWR